MDWMWGMEGFEGWDAMEALGIQGLAALAMMAQEWKGKGKWAPDKGKGKGKSCSGCSGCGSGYGVGYAPSSYPAYGSSGKKGWGGESKGKGEWKSAKGKPETKVAAGEHVFSGQLKSFNAEMNHGYVICDDVFSMCGQDVYAFRNVLEQAGVGVGDTLCFFLHWSGKGQPQASSPALRLSVANDQGFALKGVYKAGNSEKGFGFIQCPQTKDYYGRDVYVHKDLAYHLETGQTVSFNVKLNRDGMPNATAALPCDEHWEPVPGDLSESAEDQLLAGKGAKGGKGKGGKRGATNSGQGNWDAWNSSSWNWGSSGGSWDSGFGGSDWGCGGWDGGCSGCCKGMGGGKGKLGGSGSKPVSTGEFFVGTVKSFNEGNNYGFIVADEVTAKYGHDAFVHGKEIPEELRVQGTIVYFECGVSTKGQPQAMNVQSPEVLSEPAPKRLKKSHEDFDASLPESFDTPWTMAEFGASLGLDVARFTDQ
mmetsp:Transcript_18258/g.49061  ORF Transcript_18258/g.49061 Transcript_18258/m.49061 type:complete len:478 (-) Transcript_18258:135-1568(-)